jgi:hypothetical protein
MSYEDIIKIVERNEKDLEELKRLDKISKGKYKIRIMQQEANLKSWYKKLEIARNNEDNLDFTGDL